MNIAGDINVMRRSSGRGANAVHGDLSAGNSRFGRSEPHRTIAHADRRDMWIEHVARRVEVEEECHTCKREIARAARKFLERPTSRAWPSWQPNIDDQFVGLENRRQRADKKITGRDRV